LDFIGVVKTVGIHDVVSMSGWVSTWLNWCVAMVNYMHEVEGWEAKNGILW